MHPFYRSYFDKDPKELPTAFRIKYANSSNELPGIIEAGKAMRKKNLHNVIDEPHKNIKLLQEDTRGPLKKG